MAVKGKNTKKVPNLRFPGFNDEWTTETLGSVMDFKVTNSFSRDQLNYESGSVRNIHYGDIHTKFHTLFDISEEIVPFVNEDVSIERINRDNYCKEGDMIFADASEDLNDVGKSIEIVNLNNEKLISGLHTILARPMTNKFHVGFNGYLFKSKNVRTQIQKEAQGTKVLSISASRIGKINLTYPSIEEQNKITSMLSLIDYRISTQNKIIQQLESLIKGIRALMFSAKIRFKDLKGRDFPNWKKSKLDEVSQVIMGQSPDSKSYNSEGKGIPLIQGNTDIFNRTTKPRNYTTSITKQCEIGDLILTVRAPVGSVAKSAHNACIGRGVCALRINKSNNSEFFYQFLIHYEPQWTSLEQGSTFTAVNSSEVRNIEVIKPCLEEQNIIAKFLSTMESKIQIEVQILEGFKLQKKFLLENFFI